MYNLSLLKDEYIGKTYGWLTVIDVFRDSKGIILFKCSCRCGNETSCRWDKVKSGHTTSCGCYRKSSDMSARKSQWFKDNPDKVKKRSEKFSQWCKDNPDKVKEKSEKHSKFNKEHPEKLAEQGRKHSQWCRDNKDKLVEQGKRLDTYVNNPEIANKAKEKYLEWCRANPDKVQEISKQGYTAYSLKCTLHRQSIDFSCLEHIVRSDFVEKLHHGEIKFNDLIFVKCCVCGEYSPIRLGCIFDFNTNELVNNGIHLCRRCGHTVSSYESEIADYISTFYNGECIRNSRKIISPLELDLYYPEKKIAIEFNGDYWHSDEFKEKDYHYNKFRYCLEKGIILASIFEKHWLDNSGIIKNYIFDLFNNTINNLSLKNSGCIDNNYPIPNMCADIASYKESTYVYNEHIVYTCGYSKIK